MFNLIQLLGQKHLYQNLQISVGIIAILKVYGEEKRREMKGQENLRTKLLIVCVYKQNLHLCCSLDMESSKPDTAEKTAQ